MNDYANMFSLSGKVALVVGGTGGLGKPIAEAFLQNGADVVVSGRSLAKVGDLPLLAEECGRRFLAVAADVLSEESVASMTAEIAERFGRIDILVNAAGMNILKKAEEYDRQSWDTVMNLNVTGTHLVTKAVGRLMIANGYGRIVNISSVRSILGMPQDYIAYCASKGAINMYTKQLACEWAKYGITSNAIAPTFTRTPINSFQLDDPDFYNRLVSRIPLGRICTVRDIAAAAVYLCSDAAAFVTGQILGVDGGITVVQ